MELKRQTSITFLLIAMFFLSLTASGNSVLIFNSSAKDEPLGITPDLYTPVNSTPLNVKEDMTLSPIFTPDNALNIHTAWISQAEFTINIQNAYIKQFDRDVSWDQDPHPMVRELEKADSRGVKIRIQVNEGSDTDRSATYLNDFDNIEVRYMGSETTSIDDNWISDTHNKIMIIDSKVSLVSSINYGENAFLNNREAGMVIQSATVSEYYLEFFDQDWADGDTDLLPPNQPAQINHASSTITLNQGESHTDLEYVNFTGNYNVSAYVNPDNADQHIFNYLESAKESIYVTMYTISRDDFVDTLVDLKNANPSLDIQVLISHDRVGGGEDTDTQASALKLVDNLIPVYNTTRDFRFTHAKYWVIDQKHTFIYSGNWSPRSVTPEQIDPYSSGEANRDMGIAVHDAPDIANWVKTEVWDKDVAVGVAYDLPIGITQNSFIQSEVVSGTVSLSATVSGFNASFVSYTFGTETVSNLTLTDGSFNLDFDTNSLDNGITVFKVEAVDANGASFEDEITVNVVNYPESDNFRLLITEIHANPDVVADSEGEFIELTNSFPFAMLIEDWQIGEGDDLHTFDVGYEIPAYSSILVARDVDGILTGFGVEADIELSFSLANSEGLVLFLDAEGNFADVVAYGTGTAPDGSEVVGADFDAGQSISRKPLHVDTNTAADFTFEIASPKDPVPEIPLGSTPVDSEDISLPLLAIISLLAIPVMRRKNNG